MNTPNQVECIRTVPYKCPHESNSIESNAYKLIIRRLYTMFPWIKRKTAVPIDPALQQVLETKSCGQCPRNCRLSDPKCGRGKKQAEIAAKNHTKG